MKVLLVEDDKDIAELVAYNLAQAKIACQVAHDGERALSLIRRLKPKLVLLDLMLPGMDGLEVCRRVKADPATRSIPILMLTAKGDEVDRVVGFEMGADDYLTKPFSPRELILRVKAVLRRTQPEDRPTAEALSFGSLGSMTLTIDPEKFQVQVGGETIPLTAIEFKLLHYLLASKGRVATRDSLLDRVWGYDSVLTTRTVDTHVKRLRQKLGRAASYIETVRGIGYRFKEKV